MTWEEQLNAQKVGVERSKDFSTMLHKQRVESSLRMQLQLRGN
jgi:hypothetical protein